MKKLKACPFCGGHEIMQVDNGLVKRNFVCCLECHASGPEGMGKNLQTRSRDARRRWNMSAQRHDVCYDIGPCSVAWCPARFTAACDKARA